ncbi:glycosyltransferase [Nostocales cyanobacterium HT-58-2]|nr:glycosyltransferase [Nostocales cyanobacterium HT-58-2]
MAQLEDSTAVPRNFKVPLPFLNFDYSILKKENRFTKPPNYSKVEELPSLNVYLLERRISCMTVSAIVDAIYTASVEGKKITVANYNVHSFNLSMQLPWYYHFLQSAEIAHCDSIGVLKAMRWMGLNLPIEYRASYTLLMPKLLEKCNEHGFSIFLLGSKPENLEVAIHRLSQQYPNIHFFGHHGYFNKQDPIENQAVIQQINQTKSHVLVVGMGMPIQEDWIQKHCDSLQVNAIMLGGAIIDRLAGIVPDCPSFLADKGLEWLYRFCREPKRLAARYLLGNPAFILHIALAKIYASPLRVQVMQPNEVTSNSPLTSSVLTQDLPATIYSRIKRIADYFIEANLLTKAQVETVFSEPKLIGMLLGEVLEQKGEIQQQAIEYLLKKMFLHDMRTSE